MRDWVRHTQGPHHIGVLLFADFSNYCLANTIEPLRAANRLAGREIYTWEILTMDGAPVPSSSGIEIAAHARLSSARGDMLIAMPSYRFRDHTTQATSRALRAAAGRFAVLAGFDTGSWLMAQAGLLDGYRATIHWEELVVFSESFPDVTVVRERHVTDRNRVTCSGALAAFELMMEQIGAAHGQALRLAVATLFMSPDATGPASEAPLRSRTVARAVAMMQSHIEDPISIPEIAAQIGRSQKDIVTRFHAEFGTTPQAVYRRLRLLAARKLVVETRQSVAEIALRSGYQDASAMTRAFRAEFGQTPRDLRALD